ncbi:hypothetical protein KI387_009750, partial [Taxus chinensis]
RGSAEKPPGGPRSKGTSGTEVRGGREKPIQPKEEEKRLTAERDSSGQEYAKYANRPDRPKWEQIVRKQLGHLGHDDANRPVRPKQGKFVLGHPGRRDMRDTDRRRSRKPIKQRHV